MMRFKNEFENRKIRIRYHTFNKVNGCEYIKILFANYDEM